MQDNSRGIDCDDVSLRPVCAANEVLTTHAQPAYQQRFVSWKNEPRLNDLVSRPYDELWHSVPQGGMGDLSEGHYR